MAGCLSSALNERRGRFDFAARTLNEHFCVSRSITDGNRVTSRLIGVECAIWWRSSCTRSDNIPATTIDGADASEWACHHWLALFSKNGTPQRTIHQKSGELECEIIRQDCSVSRR